MTSKPWQKRPGAADEHRLRGRAGQARRKRWLMLHPLCLHCEQQGRVTAGAIVDHKVPLAKGGADDETNLQTLCTACDAIKTAADFGRKVPGRIGVDGYPIE